MRVVRPNELLPELDGPSLFLAGPTPRSPDVPSWRAQALEYLHRDGFAGLVLVPEPFFGGFVHQVTWEKQALEGCRVIAFWIPRDLESLPGFTTNVEFGLYVTSGRVVYGRPRGAPHTQYLDWIYREVCGQDPVSDLELLVQAGMERAKAETSASPRRNGARLED